MSRENPLTGAAPPARRLHPLGLRDPRLLAGAVVMALSVLVGALLFGDHAEAHTALVLRHRVHAGEALRATDVRAARVELTDSRSSARYFLDGVGLTAGASAARELAAGELLPRSAVTTGTDTSLAELPLSVAVDDLPTTVDVGSTVDVWVLPQAARSEADPRAELVLEDVRVLHLGGGGGALAPASTRQVIVGVAGDEHGDEQDETLGKVLGRAASGRVLITRRGAR